MELKDILNIIVIPIVLAVLALAYPAIQSWNRRQAFQGLILRELEEIEPFPKQAKEDGWWTHQKKTFVHQKILQDVSENRDFILSLEPDLVYLVSQLWDAKANRDETQWLYYLEKLSDPKYDKMARIAKAHQQWVVLCADYSTQSRKPQRDSE